MATPRKRWFKVADAILREPWDNDTLATVVRLMGWLNQRRARDGKDGDDVGEAVIGELDAMTITGVRRPHVAVQRLSSLPLVAGLTSASATLEKVNGASRVRLTWTKYAEFQTSTSREPGSSDPAPGSSDSDSDLRSPTPDTRLQEEESAPAETAPAAPPPTARVKRAREPKPIPPEAAQFAADFLDGLRARHEGFQGPPTLTGWERDARLMLEVRPLEEARDLARWLFEDPGRDAEFWRRNILGVPKFREQYDRLLVLRRGASYAAPDHIRPGPITQALRNIAARQALRDAN